MGGKTSSAVRNRYIAKAYDRINLTVPKGAKEVIQECVSEDGESVNGLLNGFLESFVVSKGREWPQKLSEIAESNRGQETSKGEDPP